MKRTVYLAIAIVFFSVCVVGHNTYRLQNVIKLSDIALANIEALAQDEGSGEFKCYIYKDKCIVKAKTSAELATLNKYLQMLGRPEISLDVSVDLTDATCIYSTTPQGPVVRCGVDRRCADIWKYN